MKMGIIGLGRMGMAIAQRLVHAGHSVVGFDTNSSVRSAAAAHGIQVVNTISLINRDARIIWLMIPAGLPVDSVLEQITAGSRPGDIIVDGGNSNFHDSIRRSERLSHLDISFLDCGTSGGVHGVQNGFCLMIGGDKKSYEFLEPIWKAIAASGGYAHIGPSGAGHYVKMVHNGIEYALMQAYAEGFHLLHESKFGKGTLDVEQIAQLWNHGAVIRSFLLQLIAQIFAQDQDLDDIGGQVAESGMGKWTVQEAHLRNISVSLIELALKTREWSRETGGNYATKIVALLRQQFGGHAITKLKDEV